MTVMIAIPWALTFFGIFGYSNVPTKPPEHSGSRHGAAATNREYDTQSCKPGTSIIEDQSGLQRVRWTGQGHSAAIV